MATKVSQATIDKIKKMGMTKALAGAGSANAEMKEALTRMYGARRVSAAAAKSSKPAASSAESAMRGATMKPRQTSMVDAKGPNAKKAAAPKKATGIYKPGSPADTIVKGVKRVLNSSPGASLKAPTFSNKSLTPAQKAAAKKAQAAALKRAGGRNA